MKGLHLLERIKKLAAKGTDKGVPAFTCGHEDRWPDTFPHTEYGRPSVANDGKTLVTTINFNFGCSNCDCKSDTALKNRRKWSKDIVWEIITLIQSRRLADYFG